MKESKYIRFDWAMKRLLRQKANFGILEGLLTTLLGMQIKIKRMLESESNQEEEYDKYNRVDMLAENEKANYSSLRCRTTRNMPISNECSWVRQN